MKKLNPLILLTICITALSSVSASASINLSAPTVISISDNYTTIHEYIEDRVNSILDTTAKRVGEIINRVYSSAIILNKDDHNHIHIEIFRDFFENNNHFSSHDTTEYYEEFTEPSTEISSEIYTESTTESQYGSDESHSETSLEEEILAIHNRIRSENGLSPLTIDKRLSTAAFSHAKDMYYNDYFSHNSIDGRTFAQRVNAYVKDYSTLGENIAYGSMNAEDVMELWINSEGHRNNILNSSFTHVGIGCYNGYFVVDFAG